MCVCVYIYPNRNFLLQIPYVRYFSVPTQSVYTIALHGTYALRKFEFQIPYTCTVFFHFQLSIVLTVICPSLCVLRYCVCYIHEEFNRMLQVLKKDSMVAHENCKCTCTFCALGGCKCVFETDMDMYWFMRHVLCAPDKLHSQTSRNLFPPRYNIPLLFSVCTSFNLPFFPLRAF